MDKITVNCPSDIIPLLKKYGKKRVEHFGVVGLDAGREVLFQKNIFIGGSDYAMVDPKVLFWELCSRKASAFIVYHNHPSGNCAPSEPDLELTRRVCELGHKMNLYLLDHVIMAKDCWYSLKEHGNIDDMDKEIAKKVAEE